MKPGSSVHPDILIVGAGPVGLTAAVELARRGMNLGIEDAAGLDSPDPPWLDAADE